GTRGRERKHDRERRTFPWTAALRADRAAVHLDQTLDETKAQAETAPATIAVRVSLRKWLEQTRQHFRRNSFTRVLDADDRAPAGRVRLDRHGRLATSRRKLERILKQVANDLRKARTVAVERHRLRGRPHFEPDPLFDER